MNSFITHRLCTNFDIFRKLFSSIQICLFWGLIFFEIVGGFWGGCRLNVCKVPDPASVKCNSKKDKRKCFMNKKHTNYIVFLLFREEEKHNVMRWVGRCVPYCRVFICIQYSILNAEAAMCNN